MPSHGSVTCNAVGSCSYVPNAGFVGYDGFRYAASEGGVQAGADVLVLVARATSGLGPKVKGAPGAVTQGKNIDWFVGVKPAPPGLEQSAALLFALPVEVDLGGAQAVPAGALTTAPGWSATSDPTRNSTWFRPPTPCSGSRCPRRCPARRSRSPRGRVVTVMFR